MIIIRKKFLLGLIVVKFFMLASLPVYAQYSRQECESEIKKMREVYIVILKKIPAMPPLSQLSSGIQRALTNAEISRGAGDFKTCIINLKEQISIVQGYAK